MIATLDPLNPQFIYDAKRKVGTARGTDREGQPWMLEFHERHEDDRMTIVVTGPNRFEQRVTVSEDDFAFSDNTVRLSAVPQLVMFMHPVYVKKMRGFTRGNIPTPDIAGPSLP